MLNQKESNRNQLKLMKINENEMKMNENQIQLNEKQCKSIFDDISWSNIIRIHCRWFAICYTLAMEHLANVFKHGHQGSARDRSRTAATPVSVKVQAEMPTAYSKTCPFWKYGWIFSSVSSTKILYIKYISVKPMFKHCIVPK